MRVHRYSFALLFWLLTLGTSHAADDLNIVLLDSKTGHGLQGKLVCISFPPENSSEHIVMENRECHRTDSSGSAAFGLPDPVPQKVKVQMGSNGLVACFEPHEFTVSEAMKLGLVAKNTCGDASTDTTQTGELILYAHQMSLWETLKARRDEF